MLFHHCMVIVGVPYTYSGISVKNEVIGGGPYVVSTVAGNGIGKLLQRTNLIQSVFRENVLQRLPENWSVNDRHVACYMRVPNNVFESGVILSQYS